MSVSEDRITRKRIKELQHLQLKPLADALQTIITELIDMKEELRETRGRLCLLEMHWQSELAKDNSNGHLGNLDLVRVIDVKMPRNGTRRIVETDDNYWRVEKVIKGSWNIEAGPWRCKRSAQRHIKRTNGLHK